MPKEESQEMPNCCDGCERWKQHKHNCWYFWEGKKECTQHTRDFVQF